MKFVQGSVPLVLVATILLHLSVLPTNAQQPSGCLLPSTDLISSRLTSILLSQGGEGSRTNITLVSHHFSCLAVADTSDRFASLSIAVTYTTATTGDQLLRYQFELDCSSGVYQASGSSPDANPPNAAFTESRRDCRVCTGVSGPANLIDTVTNCIFCSPTCTALGQGSCANRIGDDCCPFFTADGACTTSCPTNFVATRATNFTCTCNLSCPLGFEANSTCSGCNAVHICLTNNPCLDQGTCVIGSNNNTDYACNCQEGFTGRNCETAPLGNCTVNGESIAVGESRVFLELNRNRLYGEFVLLLDESSSMSREHVLIKQLLSGLDTSLRNLSIGNTVRNRYGLLGFSSSNDDPPFGVVYTTAGGEQFVNIENISELIDQISTGDRYEDGYAAIGLAFDQYRFEGGARQFLLVTDEDRDNLNSSLTRQVIMDKLRDTRTRLNVLVSEEFQAGDIISLGMNQNNDTFVFNPLAPAQFVRKRNGETVVDSGHGTTHVDYTELVLQTNGAVWDINTITGSPGQLNIGFINALARQKGVEIVEQLGRCLNCTCRPNDLSCVEVSSEVNTQCNITEVIRSIIPPDMSGDLGANLVVSLNVSYGFVLNGSRVTLECTAQSSEMVSFAWTFKGRTLPNNAEVTSSSIRSFLTITDFMKDNTGRYTCFAMSGSESTRSAGDRTSYLEVDFPPTPVVPTPSTVLRIQSTSSFRSSTIVVESSGGPRNGTLPLPPMPVIELQSANQENPNQENPNRITAGTDVRLICRTNDLAFISWRYGFGGLPANAVVTNSSNHQRSELNITNFDVLNNTGTYSCIARVGDAINSTSVVLVPTVALGVPNISPNNIELNEGDNINLTCTSDIPAYFTWQYRMNQLPNGVNATSISPTESRLVVRNFQENVQAGEYRCVVSLAASTRSRVVFISPRDIFRISATPMLVNRTIAEISEQNPVRFVCRLECSCNRGTVRWEQRGSAMAGPVGRTSTLTITRPEFDVNGEHQCVGIPPPGSDSQRVMLSVNLIISDVIRPVSVMVRQATQTVSQGGSANVVCESNRPVLRFEWAYLRDDDINLPDNAVFRNVSDTVSQLTVSNANNGNTGVYFCRGIFSDTDEVAIQRTQIFLPDALRVDISRSSTPGGQLTLRCSLGCTCSGARVRWTLVGSGSLPSTVSVFIAVTGRVTELTFTNIDPSNVGDYRCTATLNENTASETTTVEMI